MAVASFSSATVSADGLSVAVRFGKPGANTWVAPVTLAPAKQPVLTVGGRTIAVTAIGTPTVFSTYVSVSCTLASAIYAGESGTVAVAAGWIVDADDSTASVAAGAIVNGSSRARPARKSSGRMMVGLGVGLA